MTGPSPWSCIKVHYRVAGLSEEAWDADGAVIEDFSLFRKKKCYHPAVVDGVILIWHMGISLVIIPCRTFIIMIFCH